MTHLICYEIRMGPIRFFLPGAHSMLKPALSISSSSSSSSSSNSGSSSSSSSTQETKVGVLC